MIFVAYLHRGAADFLVGGIWVRSARVSGDDIFHAGNAFKNPFGAPKAATGEGCRFGFHSGGG